MVLRGSLRKSTATSGPGPGQQLRQSFVLERDFLHWTPVEEGMVFLVWRG